MLQRGEDTHPQEPDGRFDRAVVWCSLVVAIVIVLWMIPKQEPLPMSAKNYVRQMDQYVEHHMDTYSRLDMIQRMYCAWHSTDFDVTGDPVDNEARRLWDENWADGLGFPEQFDTVIKNCDS